jgi:hypothetical protein
MLQPFEFVDRLVLGRSGQGQRERYEFRIGRTRCRLVGEYFCLVVVQGG